MRQAPKDRVITEKELHLLRDSRDKAIAVKLVKTFKECEVPFEIILNKAEKTVFVRSLIAQEEVDEKVAEFKKAMKEKNVI